MILFPSHTFQLPVRVCIKTKISQLAGSKVLLKKLIFHFCAEMVLTDAEKEDAVMFFWNISQAH